MLSGTRGQMGLVDNLMRYIDVQYKPLSPMSRVAVTSDMSVGNRLIKERFGQETSIMEFPNIPQPQYQPTSSPIQRTPQNIFLNTDTVHHRFIRDQFERIAQLPSGRELLSSLSNHYNSETGKRLPVVFSEDKRDITAFNTGSPTQAPYILLNMWDGKRVTRGSPSSSSSSNSLIQTPSMSSISSSSSGSLLPEVYTVGSVLKSRSRLTDGTEVVEIGPGLTPFHISFAHELIHAERWNRNAAEMQSAKWGEPMAPGPYSEKYRKRGAEISPNIEEDRTVASPKEVSELRLRMEAGEPIRYLYQDSTATFYEPTNVVMSKIFHSTHRNDGALSYKIHEPDVRTSITALPQKTINPLYSGVSADYTQSVQKGAKFTRLKQLPQIYEKYYPHLTESQRADQMITDLSAQGSAAEHPWQEIVKERLKRPDNLRAAITELDGMPANANYFRSSNSIIKRAADKVFGKVELSSRPSPLAFAFGATIRGSSASSSSSSSSETPLLSPFSGIRGHATTPSPEAFKQQLRSNLQAKLQKAEGVKSSLDRSGIGFADAYAKKRQQFKELMGTYSNPVAYQQAEQLRLQRLKALTLHSSSDTMSRLRANLNRAMRSKTTDDL